MNQPPPSSDALPVTLLEHVQRIGDAKGSEERSIAFDLLTQELVATRSSDSFLRRFLLRRDRNAFRFVLEIVSRLTVPLSEELLRLLIPILDRSFWSSRLKVAAALTCLKSIPIDSPLTGEILDAVIRKASPWSASSRLKYLQRLLPQHTEIGRRIRLLEDQTKSPCPRCGVRLPHAEFVRHVWQEHRLYYEGGQVQEPWHVIEQWVREYQRTHREELIDRSAELAQTLDPLEGLTRVHRLLVAAGSPDPDAHSVLKNEARDRQASLCPHCFALAPIPVTIEPAPVRLVGGRIEWE